MTAGYSTKQTAKIATKTCVVCRVCTYTGLQTNLSCALDRSNLPNAGELRVSISLGQEAVENGWILRSFSATWSRLHCRTVTSESCRAGGHSNGVGKQALSLERSHENIPKFRGTLIPEPYSTQLSMRLCCETGFRSQMPRP